MYSDRSAILSLVAQRRITPAEAERLIVACSGDRDTWWFVAGCVLFVSLAQFQSHGLWGLVHTFRTAIEGSLPALQHVLIQIATRMGGSI
jgi:hypothetical protein